MLRADENLVRVRQGIELGSASTAVRQLAGGHELEIPWERATVEFLAGAAPWRTFRWRTGQKHYSGTYWAATEQGHVIYESRLELARLLFADFALEVRRIVAQPFLLRVLVNGMARKHIPDYLLLSVGGPIVVDVKPRARLDRPAVRSTFEWTRALVEAHGWRYEVWSEPGPVELDNVRFLAGFRRLWLFDSVLLDELRTSTWTAQPFLVRAVACPAGQHPWCGRLFST
ncbi:TnsA-like heteromeric transposase endonuclease subunit [Nocardia asiatica]